RDDSEFTWIQQQVDPHRSGKVGRDRFLTWLQSYYASQEVRLRGGTEHPNNQQAVLEPTSSSLSLSKRQIPEPQGVDERTDSPQPHKGDPVGNKVVPDWNQEYATILGHEREGTCSSDLDVIAHGLEVSSFLKSFREAAESVVHDLLAELPLAANDKCVPELCLAPNELFGYGDSNPNLQSMLAATVRKFWHQGVLVYLIQAGDSQPSISTGTNRSTLVHSVVAHKLFGHQVRAARVMHDTIHCNVGAYDALWVPLQCTIDYLGFRAFVVAAKSGDMLANETRGVISTSCSSQEQQHAWHQLTNAFNALGLMTESLAQAPIGSDSGYANCEPRPSFLPASATFAAPKGNERVAPCIFLNVADVFPPDLLSETDPTGVASLLFKFRPEFGGNYGGLLPLHSNAHAANHEPGNDASTVPRRHQQLEMQLLQHAAFSASEHLQRVVIPAFVLNMEEQHQVCVGIHMIDTWSLTAALHREGINMRYLGHCFALSSVKHVRQLFLTEMIARVCKSELRAALRVVMQNHTLVHQAKEASGSASGDGVDEEDDDNTPDSQLAGTEWTDQVLLETDPQHLRALSMAALQQEVRDVVLAFFNLVFGTCSTESKLFWRDRILPHVRLKFFSSFAGGTSDALPALDVILSDGSLLHLPQLFHALQSHAHCAFDDHLQYNFKTPEPFALSDLLFHPLMPPVTSLVARTTAHVEALLDDIDASVASEQLQDALTRVKCHLAILDAAPQDERALSMRHLLTCAAELNYQMHRYEDAAHFAQLAIDNGLKNHAQNAKAHALLMRITYLLNKSDGAMQEVLLHYAQALEIAQWHLGEAHLFLFDIYMSMSEIFRDTGNSKEALKVLQCCVTLVRDCFGRSSVVYADLRQQQGQLLYEATAGAYNEAVSILEDAVGVYENYFCQEGSVAASEEKESIPHSCKESAATCCALIATILFAGDDETKSGRQQRSTIEKAYSMALRALSLRKDVLAADHTDIMHSYLQLGVIAKALGDSFRAIEYFKAALVMQKERLTNDGDDHGEHVVRTRKVMQTMLLVQFHALPIEKRSVAEKTRARFALQFARFQVSSLSSLCATGSQEVESNSDNNEGGCTANETKLLAFVVRKLLAAGDATVYFDQLIEQTDRELQEYRKQYTMALTGSGWLSPSASPRHHHNLHSPTAYASRFASFSSGHILALASAQDGGSRSPAADRTSSFRRSSDGCNVITSPITGEFTFGGQLAALLWLLEQ
uniref:Clu domain-containing protein n=1 Tax=Globisporangium ultimum (strain ATCC 200006 / CBS 805.95 / DAOM BR144) TaxID=431595 RepID=K3WMR3_GLOUD